MQKTALYTSIVGNYDNLRQPTVVDEAFDYIVFVKKGTKKQERIGIWQVRELDYENPDNTIASRYPKMNPHKVLPEYAYTLWMDGNLVIKEPAFYEAVKQKIAENCDYAGVKHILRDCVYEDAISCMHAMRDSYGHIFRTVNFLLREHFPTHYGMYENNIILRRNDAPQVCHFNEMWWELYLAYPHRDQFTAPYCLRANGIGFNYLLPEGTSAKTSPWLEFIEHNAKRKTPVRYWYDYFACRLRTYLLMAYLKCRL